MLYGENLATVSDSVMTRATGILIPAGAFLRYRHAYGFEDDIGGTYDGGVVDYSTNNGATWNRLAADYSGTIDAGFGNPLGGQQGYVGESNGYVSESVPLTALAGQTVRFRFRVGSDGSGADYGWAVDDIGVHTCCATSPAPTGLCGRTSTATASTISRSARRARTLARSSTRASCTSSTGRRAGLTATGSQYWNQNAAAIVDTAEAGDGFGSTLTSGDFNGDGRDDLAIGVRRRGRRLGSTPASCTSSTARRAA